MSHLSDRPTADLVLIILTSVVGLSILLAGVGLFVLALVHPDWPLADALAGFGQVLGLLIGAVLGYLAGKGRSAGSQERP